MFRFERCHMVSLPILFESGRATGLEDSHQRSRSLLALAASHELEVLGLQCPFCQVETLRALLRERG